MAVLKLNNVTTLTESSGALTLANTALGTPTSVTLTNATFPAGHVVQCISAINTSNSTSTSSETPVRLTSHTGQITNVVSGNDVWIVLSFSARVTNTSALSSVGMGHNLYRESTEIMGSEGHGSYWNNSSSLNSKTYIQHISFNYMDTSPAAGTNNYFIGHEVYDLNCSTYVEAVISPFSITMLEIQR